MLIEQNNQEQQQEQGIEQRQLIERLARIEVEQMKATHQSEGEDIIRKEGEELALRDAAEAAALSNSAKNFEMLMSKITVKPDDRATFELAITNANQVAAELQKDSTGSEGLNEATFWPRWNKAEADLGNAYEKLHAQAEEDRDSSAKAAKWARIAAWSFTLLAAAMMGDWKKFFGLVGGEEKEEQA